MSDPELKISLSPVDIPDLDLDDFVDFLNNGRELDPDESATLKTLFSGRLTGIDSPLPSISSRQGSALQTGTPSCLCQCLVPQQSTSLELFSSSTVDTSACHPALSGCTCKSGA